MRVLHLISSGGMYGAEAVILNLSQELNASSQHVSCLRVFAHEGLPGPVLHEAALQVRVPSELLPCKGQIDFSLLKRLRAAVQQADADVVHAHGYKADIYAYLALRGAHGPALVSTCHTWYDNDLAVRAYGAMDRWVLRSFDQVVAVSRDVRERLLRAGVAEGRIHLIRNGISLAPFADAAELRARRGGLADGPRVGLVGRLAPEKGVDIFLRAVADVAERFPDAKFVVAGDGPDRGSLASLVDELGLRGRAELLGAQRNMPEFYASLDLLVSASRREGLPIALLEGMASGLPLVATKAGAISEVVLEGQTGHLVEPEDVPALAAAMGTLLANPELRRSFGEAGKQRVRDLFSVERMAAEYMAVYTEALTGRAASGVPQKSGI